MFDFAGSFTKSFLPTDGGYIYYGSAKSAGKFVSADEYEVLIANWHQAAGRANFWKVVGVALILVLILVILGTMFRIPMWASEVISMLIIIGSLAGIIRAGRAPVQLVRFRSEIAPPRPIAQVRLQARAALSWPIILLYLFLSGMACAKHLFSTDRSFGSWVWIINGGAFFALYLWVSIKKFQDRTG